jgi:hypothetical protein
MEINDHTREYEDPYIMSMPMVGFRNKKISLVIQVLNLVVHPMFKITIIS